MYYTASSTCPYQNNQIRCRFRFERPSLRSRPFFLDYGSIMCTPGRRSTAGAAVEAGTFVDRR